MSNRLRLLKCVIALLYIGPILAGLGGFGWAMVPVFIFLFLLWPIIMRPRRFPRNLTDLQKPGVPMALGKVFLLQVFLVLLCFGVGRGMGAMLGVALEFPAMLPVALSFVSIPLARMLWNPWDDSALDGLLDRALQQASIAEPSGDDAVDHARLMMAPINGLADDVEDLVLEQHLNSLREHVDEELMFDILLERVDAGQASASGRRALALLGSDGAAISGTSGEKFAARAMSSLHADAALVALMARRLRVALLAEDGILPDCPDRATLARLAETQAGAEADLRALLAVYDQLSGRSQE